MKNLAPVGRAIILIEAADATAIEIAQLAGIADRLPQRGNISAHADGLADVLTALARGFGSVAIQPVHVDAAKPAIRVLVRAVKGGKAATQILAGLMLNDAPGVPNKAVAEILVGKGGLALAIP